MDGIIADNADKAYDNDMMLSEKHKDSTQRLWNFFLSALMQTTIITMFDVKGIAENMIINDPIYTGKVSSTNSSVRFLEN